VLSDRLGLIRFFRGTLILIAATEMEESARGPNKSPSPHHQTIVSLHLVFPITIIKTTQVDGLLAFSFLRGVALEDGARLLHLKRLSVESREHFGEDDDEDPWEYDGCVEFRPSCPEIQAGLSMAVRRGAFPRLEELDFGFSEDGFGWFAEALREAGEESCGRSLTRVKFPQVAWDAVACGEFAALMADGTMPHLEAIELAQVENGGEVVEALVGALEAGGGRRLRRLAIRDSGMGVEGYDHAVPLPTRLGRVLADAALCPCIERVGVCGYVRHRGFVSALKARWRRLKPEDRSSYEPVTEQPKLPGVLYMEQAGLSFEALLMGF
jgi:hypothetical protein